MNSGIRFRRLILKNFLSFGPTPTVIDLTGNHITVVLGLNHDTGGDESRNGVGKSALIDSISYALFGKTVRGISNAKLVNKMMRKGQGMLVVLEFDCPSGSYRIERGEAPSKLKLFRKDLDDDNDFLMRDGKTFVYDVTRNKNETTAEIEGLIGLDIKLFEYLIANTSEGDAFMKLPEDKKREIAERLMGLNLLTQRAEELKDERKDRKKQLISEESALEATQQANKRIERQVAEIEAKKEEWETSNAAGIKKLRAQIEKLEGIDVEEQIEILTLVDEIETEQTRIDAERKAVVLEVRAAKKDLKDVNAEIESAAKRLTDLGNQKQKLDESVCPTCDQHWVADPDVVKKVSDEIDDLAEFSETSVDLLEEAEKAVDQAEEKQKVLDEEENEVSELTKGIEDFDLAFDSVVEANKAATLVETQKESLAELEAEENPYTETIAGLRKDAMKEVDDTEVKDLRRLIDHYDYLIQLLQSKDSFLRKAVIDRWLPKLNGRIAHYLETLELPYNVRIENDLTMSIKSFGEEFDWGNLSKGQRQRVTIALNLAFQDLFEATNEPLSLLMVDELIDSGICNRGASQAVKALQETTEAKDKRVFLITHRMDVADQIDDVMLVEMKNRISRIEDDEE